jgi:truncated hemoglobin YjbI
MTDPGQLRRLHDAIANDYPELVDRFYAHLEADPLAAPSLPPKARRDGLKGSMRRQFEGLLTEPRDRSYRRSRRALAETHMRTGVPASVYVRSFGVFQRCLREMLDERGLEVGPDDVYVLNLAILEDIGQVLDAGDAARRKAEEEAGRAQRQAEEHRKAEEAAHVETLQRLAAAAEFRDEDTGNHVLRMAHYTAILADAAGLSFAEVEALRVAAPMHDLGKIGIPDSILLKPGPLTDEEWTVMKTHSELGHQLLSGSNSPLLQLGAEIAVSHHERWDGGGYPNGLQGQDIPLSGRIVCIADVFDALTSRRVYKEQFTVDVACEELRRGRGTHFDPSLVGGFLRRLPEILSIRARYRD